MADNRISASLSQPDREAVMRAIATIRKKLPFLIDLTTEERRSLPKLGNKSLDNGVLNSDDTVLRAITF